VPVGQETENCVRPFAVLVDAVPFTS